MGPGRFVAFAIAALAFSALILACPMVLGLGLAAASDESLPVQTWAKGPDGVPVPTDLTPATDISNPLFALLASLIDDDLYGRVSKRRVAAGVEAGGGSNLPWQEMLWLTREPGHRGARSRFTVRFLDRLHASVPYQLLGYHPGSLRVSRLLQIREWWLGDWSFLHEGHTALAEDLSLYGLVEGEVQIDVDGWIDWLMGGRLDDIFIVGFCIFRQDGRRIALAFGYNADGKGRTGMLDLSADELVFPVPKPYLTMGRMLRSQVERRLASRL